MNMVTILVSSYDRLSDCWGPFCHGFAKYWPDCPYPAFVITNHKNIRDERIRAIQVGDDKGWSGNLLTALERISTPYVLYFQEDYWLTEPVDSARLNQYVETMEKLGLNYLRLLAFPPPDEDSTIDPRLGRIAEGADYRTALQISFWRTEVLKALVKLPETPWEFEISGTERSRKYGDSFWSVKPANGDPYQLGIRYLCSAINAGRWSREAKDYARREGLTIDFSHLPNETWWHRFQRSGRLGAAAKIIVHRLGLLRTPKIALRKIQARLGAKRAVGRNR